MVKKNSNFILITRPKKQAEILSSKLESKGYKTLISSLFKIVPNNDITPSLIAKKTLQAVLITSANAILALSKLNLPKNILIIAVGKKTSTAIKKTEYKNVIHANNSAADLQKLALQILKTDKGLIIYLSGEKVTTDLALVLQEKGYEAIRIKAYKTKEKKILSPNIIKKIQENFISQVLIYSLNSAEIFHRLILQHNLLQYFEHTKISCLSKKIADYFTSNGFKNVEVKKYD